MLALQYLFAVNMFVVGLLTMLGLFSHILNFSFRYFGVAAEIL